MSSYYVDSNSGNNGDNGTTQALAWATLEYALESGALSAGDIVWVRRTHVEYSGSPTSDITVAYSGTRGSPLKTIGWPRAAILNTTITSASWTNGSTTVDLVVGVTLSREAHCGRWITAPNGSKFLITRITDSNTLIIDREYSGPSVTLTDGKFQIEEDEDYDDRPADVDGWDSDAHALPCIDFNDTAYQIYITSQHYLEFYNLDLRDTSDTSGMVFSSFSYNCLLKGCLLYNNNIDAACARLANGAFFERCILEGGGASGSYGINNATPLRMKDCAIYGHAYGANLSGIVAYLENVNIGVESTNSSWDISTNAASTLKGRDVKLGSTTKMSFNGEGQHDTAGKVKIENYGKVLGKHVDYSITSTIESHDVVAGSGDPYKRSGGADKIIQVDCSISSDYSPGTKENCTEVFCHEFETGTTSKSYRYYVQCKDLALTADELWLEVEHVDSYDDTSEYTIIKAESDETCSLRSGVSDWTQYIEVTGIAPAVASKVRIRCFVAKHDADGYIYIDPQVVVS